ncbi:tRNA (guanosine(37)-N1)-methyltransferase TrmD [Brochothrix thermosphacta]|uniref:tRNA (guanosine(37)-N1)-methyltransferase TrmD n=1 Tax=Brochothrix thermosphacta TaxID=2756 RepID=UPI000E77027F|nr:tRNA (guanosine(37)-N1)-methyltransferase TrmD [Brochothrix thermosphacta]ANZ97579.1 tRNA (guanosine(37)-N1)-methyltransferase TrmD [Brochothrix thermosphacta]
MKIDILTLFPEMFKGVTESSIIKNAIEKKLVDVTATDFRPFSTHRQGHVDDYPYGGGAGMLLMAQPLFDAVAHLKKDEVKPRVILLDPAGVPYTQKLAEELAQEEQLIMICGHYEGYDERIREHLVTDEISIGDYILTGGEVGAMAIMDSVVRLLPGALGNDESAITDSFSTGLLEHPHYTRPAEFRGLEVPSILTSGHHANIERWRHEESLRRTAVRRPDLLEIYPLTDEDRAFLKAENLFEAKETNI